MRAKFLLFFLLGVAPLTAAPYINWFMADAIESGTTYGGGAVIAEGVYPWTITIYREGVQIATGTIGASAPMNDTGNKFVDYSVQTSVPPNLQATKRVKIYIPNSTAPSAPSQLTASNFQSNGFTLSWTPPPETFEDPIHYYEIYQDGNWMNFIVATSNPGVTPAPTSYAITDLTPNITYSYTVRARDWAGNWSGFSAPLAVAVDTNAPTAPGTISITGITPTTADASWGASSDNVGVSGYEVQLLQGGVGGSVISTQNTTATSLGFSGLTASTSYGVSVVAYDAVGNRSTARTGSFTTAANPAPDPDPNTTVPTNLTAASVTTSSFVLSWNPVVNGATISHYEVELNGTILPYVAGESSELFRTITGLNAGTAYTVRVRSVDTNSQMSPWSASLTVTTAVNVVSLPTSITRPTGSGSVVGTLGGSVSVDNRGSANYAIPLAIPPGRSGFQPSLALSYSSGAGNGPVGVGWSLSTGYPQSITRGRSILARDGMVQGVTFTSSDKLYLDGKRLICVGGSEGSPGSTYRTEVDSFVTVTAFGASGIDRFELVDKSGTKMTFGKLGAETDGFQRGGGELNEIAYSYALKRVEDTLGNYLAFTYQNLGEGEYVLQKIDYTGGPSINPAASVEFAYEARADQPTTSLTRRYFAHRARLAVITAKNSATTTAAYGLNYDYAPDGGSSRLLSIAPVLADPNTGELRTITATQFQWTSTVNKPAINSTPGPYDGYLPQTVIWGDFDGNGSDEAQYTGDIAIHRITGDINGDGVTDYVTITFGNQLPTQPGSLSFSSSCGSIDTTAIRNLLFDPPNANSGVASKLLEDEGMGVASRFSMADFTGDGRADLLVHSFDGHLYLFRSQGTSFAAPIKSTYHVGGGGSTHAVLDEGNSGIRWPGNYLGQTADSHFFVQPMPGDLNGDGMVDYVFSSTTRGLTSNGLGGYYYAGNRTVTAVLSTSDGGFSQAVTPTGLVNYTAGLGTPASTMKFESVYAGARTGDFNGDGMTDLLVLDNKPNANDPNAFGIMGYRWLLLLSNGQTSDGKPSFTHVIGVIPNSFTYSGKSLRTYFKPVTDAKWGQMNNITTVTSGSGSPWAGLFAAIESGAGSANTFAVDLNHDGLDDLLWYVDRDMADAAISSDIKGWWVMYSQGRFTSATSPTVPGTGFSAPVRTDDIPIGYGRPGNNSYDTMETTLLRHGIDANGDGHGDLVVNYAINGSGMNSALYLMQSGDRVSPPEYQNVVRVVTDGLQKEISIAYKAAKDAAVYTPGATVSYPIRDLRASTPVVSDVWHDSGASGQPAQFSYQYSGNRLDLSGRGSLGFHSFVTLDRQTNLFKYQFLAQSFPMTGLTHRDETYRWWNDGQDRFRFISSHDNTVVFDKVATGGGATLWPFISKAVEYRWEDSTTAHFSFAAATANSHPEGLFTQTKPTEEHIKITAESRFDGATATQLTLPGVSGYNPSDLSGSANTVAGTTTFATFSGLPGAINYGNLTQLSTDFGSGFTETVVTTYKSPVGALTGLVDTVTTTVTAPPPYNSESAPVRSYTYFGNTPLVASETLDAIGTNLDLTTTYARDARGRVTNTTISSPDAAIGTYSVSSATAFDDRWDQPTTSRNADPYLHPTTAAYHSFLGLPTSVTDVNGAQVTTSFDALGRATTVTDVLKGLTTTTTYAADGSQSVSAPSGVVGITIASAYKVTVATTAQPTVTTWFDRLGRPIRSLKDGFNGQQVFTDTAYNKLGQAVATSLPYPSGGTVYWTRSTYDALGRVSSVTAPNGTVTTNTYAGRTTSVTVDATDRDPQTNATLVDAKGRTISVWNADNVGGATPSIVFSLDGFGRMRATALKDQSQPITATYDALGRQTQLADPDKGTWNYLNNALGQVVTQTDARSNVTTSTFDRLGRPLTRTTTGNGATETADFHYYDTSTVTTASQHTVDKGTKGWIGAPQREEATATGSYPTVNLHYYDEKGRPSLEMAQTDGKWFYTATHYDAYSRPHSVRHYWKPAGAELPTQQPYTWQDFGYVYTYDGSNGGNALDSKSYLLSIADSLGRLWWDSPVYDHLDRVTSVRKGSGYTTGRTYRPADGVLTNLNTGAIQAMVFGFDGLGNLTSRSDTGVSETFTYDNLNRLKTSSIGGTINYEANGNIQFKTGVDGTASGTYSYDGSRPHAVATAFGYAMTYDGNGNLLTRTKGAETWSMKWAGFDKPRWMAKTEGGSTVGSEFHYNAARSRVMQLEFDQMTGGAPSRYVRKRTYALGSTLELNYTTTAPALSPTWTLDTVRIYVPGPDGIIGAREFRPASGGTEKSLVYHHDHLGSITAITDWGSTGGHSLASGNKSGRYSEDAWGQRRDPLDWNGAPTAATDDGGPDSLTPRGFTGHEMLDDLGLVHMNGRIYDPLLGRMLSADRVVPGRLDLQAYNRYTYVLNNPLRYTDPDGNEPKDVAAGAIEGPAHAVIDVGSQSPGLQNFNDGALMMMGLSNLLGNDKDTAYYSSLRAEGQQMQQSLSDNAERMKTVVSDWASAKTGSTDVNHSQRAFTRTTTNALTKLFVAVGGAKFIDRLSGNQIKNGSGDQGGIKTRQPSTKTKGNDDGYEEPKSTTSLYHKGKLKNGVVDPDKGLSTGTDKDKVESLTNREGEVHQFEVPKDKLKTWEQEGSAVLRTDHDATTGTTQPEVRINPPRSGELNKYKVPPPPPPDDPTKRKRT